jgi:hypothetical protein
MHDVKLAYGSHMRIQQAVTDVQVSLSPESEVQLVASIVPETPTIPLPPTSIGVHMDREAAGVLLKRLRDLFRTSGWPVPR